MIMTGYSNVRTTIEAEDLGVADYVTKPFDDLAGVLERVREQALTSLEQGRERQYLGRIKKRHEGVLKRYREMAAAFDSLK
jgi:DNA-binding NtrC family response regulator